ncbi:MAG: hypothetical protein SFZ23_08365 [Planctomycetota bacterium]|nr:hypothetical protein [Planctomycetota bacterium]
MAQQPASKQIAPTSSGTMQPKGSNPAARSRLAPCERQDAAQLGCPDGDDSVASVPNQASPVGVFGAFIGGVSVLLLVALSLHVVASAPASTPDSRGVGSQRADLVGVLAQLAGRQSSADDRLSPTVDLPSTRQRSARVACVALLLAESTGTGLAPEASRGRVRLALLHLPPPANLARGC